MSRFEQYLEGPIELVKMRDPPGACAVIITTKPMPQSEVEAMKALIDSVAEAVGFDFDQSK